MVQDKIQGRIRSLRRWRTFWGVLCLLCVAWVGYGFIVSSSAYTTTAAKNASDAYQAGAAIGASVGIAFFCGTALIPFLIFLFAYARSGSALRSEQQHLEQMDAINKR